jgi:hypothetical protein
MDKKTTYTLRVSIKESTPLIWRELSVPADYTLEDLHRVIQIAFGWEDDHMHSFTVNAVDYSMVGEEFDAGEDPVFEDEVCLSDLNLHSRQKFTYLYDFGDCWEHEVRVSKIVQAGVEKEDGTRPRCLGGERAAPLEDSGGVWDYENMLEILKDPNHARYESVHEWAGDIDPERFDREEINARLEKAFHRGSPLPRQTR